MYATFPAFLYIFCMKMHRVEQKAQHHTKRSIGLIDNTTKRDLLSRTIFFGVRFISSVRMTARDVPGVKSPYFAPAMYVHHPSAFEYRRNGKPSFFFHRSEYRNGHAIYSTPQLPFSVLHAQQGGGHKSSEYQDSVRGHSWILSHGDSERISSS